MSSEFKKYLKESLYSNRPDMRRITNNEYNGKCTPCQRAKVEQMLESFGDTLNEEFDIESLIQMFKPMIVEFMKKYGVDTSDMFDLGESYLGEGVIQNLLEFDSAPILPEEQEEDDDWGWIWWIIIIGGIIYYIKKKKKKKRGPQPGGGGGGGGIGPDHPGDGGDGPGPGPGSGTGGPTNPTAGLGGGFGDTEWV